MWGGRSPLTCIRGSQCIRFDNTSKELTGMMMFTTIDTAIHGLVPVTSRWILLHRQYMQGVWQSRMRLHRCSFGDSGAMHLYDTLGNSQHPILCEKTSHGTTCSTWFIPMRTSQTYSCDRHLHVRMGHNSISSYGSECACMDHDNRNNAQTRGLCI